ncbi:hypothetical protein BDW59DRAFT_54890 [Aspergillus cavernicola]|uniref:Uncharacterized protein n=1 Tax=Aspergillus cavernicola TaxID=176166 RepID=A0ABR4IJB1_9EURO
MRTHDDFMRDLANSSTSHEPPQDYPFDGEESRRKKTCFVRPSASICRDWMIVSGNCHYARDGASFTTYTPVNTLIKNNIFSPLDEMQVAGVGSVHLTVPRGPHDSSTHTLVLDGVLHIPEAVCNGFNPLLIGSSMSCHSDYWEGADRAGSPMWFGLPFVGLSRLVLAGGLGGESELIQGRVYTLSLYISPQERGAIMGG